LAPNPAVAKDISGVSSVRIVDFGATEFDPLGDPDSDANDRQLRQAVGGGGRERKATSVQFAMAIIKQFWLPISAAVLHLLVVSLMHLAVVTSDDGEAGMVWILAIVFDFPVSGFASRGWNDSEFFPFFLFAGTSQWFGITLLVQLAINSFWSRNHPAELETGIKPAPSRSDAIRALQGIEPETGIKPAPSHPEMSLRPPTGKKIRRE
jgi:hypothetical protein